MGSTTSTPARSASSPANQQILDAMIEFTVDQRRD